MAVSLGWGGVLGRPVSHTSAFSGASCYQWPRFRRRLGISSTEIFKNFEWHMVKEENWACAWLPPSACPPAKVTFQEKATSSLGKIYCCGEGRKIKDENLGNNRTNIHRSLHPDVHLAVLSKEYHELVILTIGKGCNLEDIGVYNFDVWMISSFLSCVDFEHSFSLLWYRYKSYSLNWHVSEITVSLFPDMWGHFAYTAWKMFSARASWQRQRGFCFGKGGSDPFSIAGLGGGCIFSLTSSLPYSAVLLDMERNFTLMFVVKICLSSCYQLSAQLGNKMPQGSQETKCSVIVQTKKSHICFLHESFQSSSEEDKKPSLKRSMSSKVGNQHQLSWSRNLSWTQSTCACEWSPVGLLMPGSAAAGSSHIWEKVLQCWWEVGEYCWKKFTSTLVLCASHWREELRTAA